MSLFEMASFVRFAGWFNIMCALPLSTPWTAPAYLKFFGGLSDTLELGGETWIDFSHPSHHFLSMTAGIDFVLIGVIVLWASRDLPRRKALLAFNAMGRLIWTAFMIIWVTLYNLWPILLVFGAIDILISAVFFAYLMRSAETTE